MLTPEWLTIGSERKANRHMCRKVGIPWAVLALTEHTYFSTTGNPNELITAQGKSYVVLVGGVLGKRPL